MYKQTYSQGQCIYETYKHNQTHEIVNSRSRDSSDMLHINFDVPDAGRKCGQ